MSSGSTKSKSAVSKPKPDAKKPPSSVKLTPRKTATENKPTPEAKPATVVQPAKPVSAKTMLKKAELVDQVVEKTGVKKRDAKVSVEAALAILAQALADETDLNLPPLGKVRMVKSKDLTDGAKALTLKLRTMKSKPTDGKTEE